MVFQIDTLTVGPPEADGYCRLDGTIRRAFAGPHAVGTRIRTRFPCDNSEGRIGGEVFTDPAGLARRGAAELHIAPEGGPAAYGGGLIPLDALTEAPVWRPFCG